MLFVEGQRAEETSGMVNPDIEDASIRFAERLFSLMDENNDGELTIEEFVKGFHKLKVQGNCYGDVTVTAYITERTLTKEDLLPKPAIPLRRKSLRRGSSSVKLFNNESKNRNDPEEAKTPDGKGNNQAAVFNASSIASAAKAKMHKDDDQAAVINASSIIAASKFKAKMHKDDDQAAVINASSIIAASKFKAKAKLHKKETVRKLKKNWKIMRFW